MLGPPSASSQRKSPWERLGGMDAVGGRERGSRETSLGQPALIPVEGNRV